LPNNKDHHRFDKKTTRRGFLRSFATSWGGSLKEALHTAEYPLEFNGIRYYTAPQNNNNLILSCTETLVTFPENLGYGRICPRSMAARNLSEKNLALLAQEIKTTHLIWDCATAKTNLTPPYPAVVLNAEMGFKASAPSLFLFSQDQALLSGDSLGQILRNQPHTADLYIGRINEDLTDPESPTWQRLKLFFAEH